MAPTARAVGHDHAASIYMSDRRRFRPARITETNYGLTRTEYPHSHDSSRNPVLTVPLRIYSGAAPLLRRSIRTHCRNPSNYTCSALPTKRGSRQRHAPVSTKRVSLKQYPIVYPLCWYIERVEVPPLPRSQKIRVAMPTTRLQSSSTGWLADLGGVHYRKIHEMGNEAECRSILRRAWRTVNYSSSFSR
jgi:hypothetical protein